MPIKSKSKSRKVTNVLTNGVRNSFNALMKSGIFKTETFKTRRNRLKKLGSKAGAQNIKERR